MADHKVETPSANNADHSSSRFHKKQGEIISEIHEALDNQAASSTLNQEQPKSEVRRRHNPSEEQPPEVEERKPTTGELSGNRVEPHTIIECIQQGSDSVKSWLERTVRGAHANPIILDQTTADKFAEEVESDLAVEFKLFSPKLAFLSLPW